MAILQLQGSDYFEGVDGVRRMYGPGLFDVNDAGQIIGPHVDAADGQEPAQSEPSAQDVAPPQSDVEASQSAPMKSSDNGG